MAEVIETILKRDDLPSPPAVALRLLSLYDDSEVEVQEMAEVIGADPILAGKLIEYCNSPLLARNRETTNLRQAIVIVGMRAVKILALSFSLVQKAAKKSKSFDYNEFWNRSLANAVIAKVLASPDGKSGDDEFLVALMLSVGKIGLAHGFPEKYALLNQNSEQSDVSLRQLERQQWSVDHFDVSIALLNHWHFPPQVVQCVVEFAYDQRPDSRRIGVLKLARAMVDLLFKKKVYDNDLAQISELAQQQLGITDEEFRALFNQSTAMWVEYAKLLSFDASQSKTFEQLESRARKGIAQLCIGLQAENTAISRDNNELRSTAMFDSLTSVRNRRAYNEEAPAEWERCRRLNHSFALMMVDIDFFKQVNDTHGHAVGDTALRAVADVLSDCVRQYDSVYRFGGEEFVLILPECDCEFAIAAAERYRAAIQQMELPLGDSILKVTVSIGVAVAPAGSATSGLDELLEVADQMLYQAKNEGRNRVGARVLGSDGIAPALNHPNCQNSAPATETI